MDRVYNQDVENRVERLNAILLRYRSKRRVKFAGRYDYVAIDEYGTDGCFYGCIIAGTKRECYEGLGYMIRALDLEHQK